MTSDQDIERMVYANDCYRLRQLDLAGKTFLDLGGHHGWCAKLAFELGADVWSYEPHPGNYGKLADRCHNLDTVLVRQSQPQLIRAAVIGGETMQSRQLNVKGDESCGHSIVWHGHGYDDWIPVWGIPLDVILVQLNHVDVCKMDIEGAEYEVLTDSKQLDRIDRLIVEWHPVAFKGPGQVVDRTFVESMLRIQFNFKPEWEDKSIDKVTTVSYVRSNVRHWSEGVEVQT